MKFVHSAMRWSRTSAVTQLVRLHVLGVHCVGTGVVRLTTKLCAWKHAERIVMKTSHRQTSGVFKWHTDRPPSTA